MVGRKELVIFLPTFENLCKLMSFQMFLKEVK